MAREVVIVSAVRTPIGSFGGSLAEVPATQLGAAAVKGAIEKGGIDPKAVTEVNMGSVLQANLNPSPDLRRRSQRFPPRSLVINHVSERQKRCLNL